MARYIDADDFLDLFYVAASVQDKEFTKTVEMVVADTPTADVVEVVRCKDCKSYKTDTDYCKEYRVGYCEWDNTVKTKMHFCSYGERRANEEK